MFKGLGRRKGTTTRRATTEGAGAIISTEIEATSEVVWDLLINVANHEKLYRTCSGVKNLNPKKSLNPVEPGAKYLRKRTLQGKMFEFVTYVTVMDHTAHIYAEATSFLNCTATMTVRLEDLEDGRRCRLLGTYGMVPDGFWGRLFLWRNRNRSERNNHEDMMMDLSDLKHAAETGRCRKDSSSNNPNITETNDTSSSDRVDFYGRTAKSEES